MDLLGVTTQVLNYVIGTGVLAFLGGKAYRYQHRPDIEIASTNETDGLGDWTLLRRGISPDPDDIEKLHSMDIYGVKVHNRGRDSAYGCEAWIEEVYRREDPNDDWSEWESFGQLSIGLGWFPDAATSVVLPGRQKPAIPGSAGRERSRSSAGRSRFLPIVSTFTAEDTTYAQPVTSRSLLIDTPGYDFLASAPEPPDLRLHVRIETTRNEFGDDLGFWFQCERTEKQNESAEKSALNVYETSIVSIDTG